MNRPHAKGVCDSEPFVFDLNGKSYQESYPNRVTAASSSTECRFDE